MKLADFLNSMDVSMRYTLAPDEENYFALELKPDHFTDGNPNYGIELNDASEDTIFATFTKESFGKFIKELQIFQGMLETEMPSRNNHEKSNQ